MQELMEGEEYEEGEVDENEDEGANDNNVTHDKSKSRIK